MITRKQPKSLFESAKMLKSHMHSAPFKSIFFVIYLLRMNADEDDGDNYLRFNTKDRGSVLHLIYLPIMLHPSQYSSLFFCSQLSKTFSISFAIVIGAYQIYTNPNCVYFCALLRLLLLCEVNYCNV